MFEVYDTMLLRVSEKHHAATRGTRSKMFCAHLIIGTGCVRMCVARYATDGERMVIGQDKLYREEAGARAMVET
jgi:hypothetical protein